MYNDYRAPRSGRLAYPVLHVFSFLLRFVGWTFIALSVIGLSLSLVDVSKLYDGSYLASETRNFYTTVAAIRLVLNLYSSVVALISGVSFVLTGEFIKVLLDIAQSTAETAANSRSLHEVERYTRQLVESLPEPESGK
jgi:uncharacterized membrane protein